MVSSRWFRTLFLLNLLLLSTGAEASEPKVAYDMEMAKGICDQLPLENVEGIWLYPDDKVTVMILAQDNPDGNSLTEYNISVVKTSDARLHPGDNIGRLLATADKDVFKIELFTEKNNDFLVKPKSCIATLSKDHEELLIKKQKSPFKGRLNLNFSRLLPGFWKIVSTGISSVGSGNQTTQPPVGMIKIYPSYDHNNSSKRKVRYL